MKPMPIRYVSDMTTACAFYEALGLTIDMAQRPPKEGPPTHWIELGARRGALALHFVADGTHSPAVELAFDAEEPLEKVVQRLRAAGFEPASEIVDEAFGRSFTVRDPEGLLLQVNEHDRGLTT